MERQAVQRLSSLGEEYIHRGLLYVLAISSGHHRMGFFAVNLSFAAWHLPDEWGNSFWQIAFVMVAMFVASFAFFVIRRRSENLAGPALLHAANNVGFSLIA